LKRERLTGIQSLVPVKSTLEWGGEPTGIRFVVPEDVAGEVAASEEKKEVFGGGISNHCRQQDPGPINDGRNRKLLFDKAVEEVLS
jgi:hypothetical protein